MKIQVTNEDIKKGEQGSCEWCPVALAIQRTYDLKNGKDKMVTVDDNTVGVWEDKDFQKYQLPRIARDFIHTFDNWTFLNDRTYFKPFSFKIGKRIKIKE
jgi:hypothetical protein